MRHYRTGSLALAMITGAHPVTASRSFPRIPASRTPRCHPPASSLEACNSFHVELACPSGARGPATRHMNSIQSSILQNAGAPQNPVRNALSPRNEKEKASCLRRHGGCRRLIGPAAMHVRFAHWDLGRRRLVSCIWTSQNRAPASSFTDLGPNVYARVSGALRATPDPCGPRCYHILDRFRRQGDRGGVCASLLLSLRRQSQSEASRLPIVRRTMLAFSRIVDQ